MTELVLKSCKLYRIYINTYCVKKNCAISQNCSRIHVYFTKYINMKYDLFKLKYQAHCNSHLNILTYNRNCTWPLVAVEVILWNIKSVNSNRIWNIACAYSWKVHTHTHTLRGLQTQIFTITFMYVGWGYIIKCHQKSIVLDISWLLYTRHFHQFWSTSKRNYILHKWENRAQYLVCCQWNLIQ